VNRRDFLARCGAGAAGLAWPWNAAAQPNPSVGFRFADVTRPAGLQFRHNNGAYGGKLLPETLGAGCAFLDYDGDG
jgi:hypothetical protein